MFSATGVAVVQAAASMLATVIFIDNTAARGSVALPNLLLLVSFRIF